MNHIFKGASERRARHEFTLTSGNTNVNYYGAPIRARKRDIWPPLSSTLEAEGDVQFRRETVDRLFTAPNEPTALQIPAVPQAKKDQLYDPLYDGYEIRLVELLPGNYGAPLELTFHTADLRQDHLPYEALSYVWGDPSTIYRKSKKDELPKIVVDGHQLSIPTNLEYALRRLRNTHRSRLLWADSVCINQSDIRERGHQVGLMSEVYSNAWRVVVWLGNVDRYRSECWKDIENVHAEQGFGAVCEVVNDWLKASDSDKRATYLVREAESAPNSGSPFRCFDKFEIDSNTVQSSDAIKKQFSSSRPETFYMEPVLSKATQVHLRRKLGSPDEFAQKTTFGQQAEPEYPLEDPMLKATVVTALQSGLWEALKILYSCSWFWRLWVLQEIVLARSAIVCWGHCEIDWRFMGVASAILRNNYHTICEKMQIGGMYNSYLMFRMSRMSDLPAMKLDFLRVLRLTRQFEVTDSRDRVFGLLGLNMVDNDTERGKLFLRPDYGIDSTTLWKRVVNSLLAHSKQLQFLSSVQYSSGMLETEDPTKAVSFALRRQSQASGTLPSWTPQWDFVFRATLSPWDIDEKFSASEGLDTGATRIESDTLKIEGMEVGIVIHTLSFMWHDVDISLLWSEYLQKFFKTEDGLRLLASTMTAGRNGLGSIVSNSDSTLADFAAYVLRHEEMGTRTNDWQSFHDGGSISRSARDQKRTGADGPSVKLLQKLAMGGSAERFLEVAMTYCERRRLFITANGFLGLGPDNLVEGDSLVVLAGCEMPFLLRRQNEAVGPSPRWHSATFVEHPSHFLLVGESYVQELMHGEAIQKLRDQKSLAGAIDPDMLWTEVVEKVEQGALPPRFMQRASEPNSHKINDTAIRNAREELTKIRIERAGVKVLEIR